MAQPALPEKITPSGTTPSPGAFALGLIDLLPDPVIVVDRVGKVQARNHAARQALSRRRGLRLDANDRLTHGQPRTARDLSQRIAATAAGIHDERPVRAPGASGPPDLVSLRPLEIEGTRFVAVFIKSVPKPAVPGEAQIEMQLCATRMEARVAKRLAAGMPLDEIAADLDVALPTVRGHLKQLYTKTGAHRQAELVCLVLSLGQQAQAV